MEIWQAIVLGAVQGFTEFLPVSSSGHLILLQNWFGIEENALFYSVMLHLGTLIPVVLVLWKNILEMFKKPFKKFGLWVLATIPAGVVGIVIALLIDLDALFAQNIWLLSITFLITAGQMVFSDIRCKKSAMDNGITLKTAGIMGIGQAFGVLPGISRSGTVATFGCIARVDKKENASFTFIMSIPLIVCAAGLETLECIQLGTIGNIDIVPLLLGILTAMVTGYIAIKFMLDVIRKANYKWFAVYLVGISVANLITVLV